MSSFFTKMKKQLMFFAVILTTIFLICPLLCLNVYATGISELDCPDLYKQIAINFFEEQYKQQDIEYNNMSVVLESDLYDSEENVVAKSVVVNRDNEYDYVILNLATCGIDEFGFNNSSALDKYSNKMYYTGVLNYYTKENNKFKSYETNEYFSTTAFKKISAKITEKYNSFKKSTLNKLKSGGNPLPDSNLNEYNGFYSYSKVDTFMTSNSYEFYDSKFLTGIMASDVADGLNFKDQNIFNKMYGTDLSCGPTALTNLMIYLNWFGTLNKDGELNALRLNSEMETFNRFRQLTNHSVAAGGIKSDKVRPALIEYAKEQNYNYYVQSIITFEQFKNNLNSEYPVVTFINLEANENRSYFGHFVLSLGYLQYRYEYQVQHQVLWHKWTTTEYKYSNYLRVIDGWSTSNEGRFIDYSGFWDTLYGTAFKFVN